MPALPSGTVTFLFTDIERSTRLWQHYPERMPRVYQRHDAIIRDAAERHGGVVFKTIGDAFQLAFPTASGAVLTAVSAQQALQAESWPIPEPFRVRMAIHQSEATPTDDGDYRIPALNLLGRLLGAVHGEQIVATAAVWPAYGLDEKHIDRWELGSHHLRDLGDTPELHQVIAQGIRQDFPPLRTGSPPPSNLSAQPPPFVGRLPESETLRNMLLQPHVRLLTVTGAGGIGKTRLALEVAASLRPRFTGGVFVVELAAITDGTYVLSAIASAIGVAEEPGSPVLDVLTRTVAASEMLLIADNLEQIHDSVSPLASLLGRCPNLTVLATSRIPLRSRWEHIFTLDPLPTPAPDVWVAPDILETNESVKLFMARARALAPGFVVSLQNAQSISEVCIRLEGLPLALELAAARIERMSPAEMARQLASPLRVLHDGPGDLPVRHRTLEGTIAWSYRLLTKPEQDMFLILAGFSGGAFATQLRQVRDMLVMADALEPTLETLLAHGLVRQQLVNDEPFMTMPVPVREFGRRLLMAHDDRDDILRARGATLLGVALPVVAAKLADPGAIPHLYANLDALRDTLREGLDWALANDPGQALGLCGALWPWWYARGRLAEAEEWLRAAMDRRHGADAPPSQVALALSAAGELGYMQGASDRTDEYLREGLALARTGNDPDALAILLNALGCHEMARGNHQPAIMLLDEMLTIARSRQMLALVSMALCNLSLLASRTGDVPQAVTLMTEARAIAREQQDDETGVVALINLAEYRLTDDTGDIDAALAEIITALESLLSNEHAPIILAAAYAILAQIAHRQAKVNIAARLVNAANQVASTMGTGLDMMLALPDRHLVLLRDLSNAGLLDDTPDISDPQQALDIARTIALSRV